MCTKAVVYCDRAAVYTLPINLFFSVLFTFFLTGTKGFQLAVFAAEIFLFGMLFETKLLLTVNHATEVGFLAVVALVESACMHRELEQFALIMATFLY